MTLDEIMSGKVPGSVKVRYQPVKEFAKYGRWTVVDGTPRIGDNYRRYFKCKCICGTSREVESMRLKSGLSKSCGCLHREITANIGRTHGMSGTREFRTWKHMKERCLNPNVKDFKNYGGRGIQICKRWLSFEKFYLDMGPAPQNHSLDRINTNGNYTPSNCRWSTSKIQNRNRRDNVMLRYKNKIRCMSEWAELAGIPVHTINYHVRKGRRLREIFRRLEVEVEE